MTWDGGSLGDESSSRSRSSSMGIPSSSSEEDSSLSGQSTVAAIQDGCVVLGRESAGAVPYVTRHWVNHKKQNASSDVTRRLCCPFAHAPPPEPEVNGGDQRLSCCGATWSVLHSECFLVVCHLIVLSVGVLKEIFYMRQWDNDLHLMHSILENVLCALVILIRILAVCKLYNDLKGFITKHEHISSKRNIRGRSIRTALILYILLGVGLLLTIAGSFVTFYFLTHLGWTVLVTNFSLTVMAVAFTLFQARLAGVEAVIRTDQQKLVLHESVLLLKEGLLAVSGDQRMLHYQRTNHFLSALRNSRAFSLPSYIHVVDGFDQEAITLKELESTV